MTPQQIQNRAMRREQVERCLAADMTIKEWCGLNHVGESTMYRWMSVFRREEPELFSDPTQRVDRAVARLDQGEDRAGGQACRRGARDGLPGRI